MRRERITKGAVLRFEGRDFICDDYNGSIVYGTAEDWETGEKTEEMLTYSDINEELHNYDGKNHSVIWWEEEEDEEEEL